MKDLSQTVLAAATKQMEQEAPLIRLIEVELPTDPVSMLRLANYDRNVQFGNTSTGAAITYSKFPVAVGEFRENRTGDLSQVQINVGNVTRELMGWIDGYQGLLGQKVRLLIVSSVALADGAARLVFEGRVVACEVDDQVAVFSLGQPSLNRQVFPARRYLTACGVIRFGDSECGYTIPGSPTNAIGGGFDFCPRSLAACRERGDDEVARGLARKHPARFQGYPGIAPGNP